MFDDGVACLVEGDGAVVTLAVNGDDAQDLSGDPVGDTDAFAVGVEQLAAHGDAGA